MFKTSHVYIMASKPYGTLYVGVTARLDQRVYEHKFRSQGFVKQYNVKMLVYFKEFYDITEAIKFETLLKSWHREWKFNLIESFNPHWEDLFSKVSSFR